METHDVKEDNSMELFLHQNKSRVKKFHRGMVRTLHSPPQTTVFIWNLTFFQIEWVAERTEEELSK